MFGRTWYWNKFIDREENQGTSTISYQLHNETQRIKIQILKSGTYKENK